MYKSNIVYSSQYQCQNCRSAQFSDVRPPPAPAIMTPVPRSAAPSPLPAGCEHHPDPIPPPRSNIVTYGLHTSDYDDTQECWRAATNYTIMTTQPASGAPYCEYPRADIQQVTSRNIELF